MNKLAAVCALSGILLAGITAVQANDEGHGMNIYGRLEPVKSGCTVLMSKYVLDLHHADKTLPKQGSHVDSTRADERVFVQLGGEHCDAEEGYSKIGLKFLGSADQIEANTLANVDTSDHGAMGTGVQLSDMFNNIIKPNVTIARFPATSATGQSTTATASFPLYLSLVELKGQEATPGNVQTNLTVQIERL